MSESNAEFPPVVTVCVPTYNHESFVAEALESVFSQSVEGLLVIVSDDASQDKTVNILDQFKERYQDQLILIKNEVNLGLAKNIEIIYQHIPEETKYISWFSGDDIMLPEKFAQQVNFLDQNPDYMMCYHDTLVREELKGTTYRYNDFWLGQKAYSGNITDRLIKQGCFISGLSALINRAKTRQIKHNPDLGIYNDWAYFIEISRLGKVAYLNKALGVYRRHGRNITRTVADIQGVLEVLRYIRTRYPDLSQVVFQGLMRQHLAFAWKKLLVRDLISACVHFTEAFKLLLRKPAFTPAFVSITVIYFTKRMALFLKTGTFFR